MVDYQGVLADLKAKRAALEVEHDALSEAIKAIERILSQRGSSGPAVVSDHSARGPGAFVGLTMPQAVLKVLRSAPEALATAQVKAAIIGGGMRGGTNIGSHIYNTLHRLSQNGGPIRREQDGRWSLS